MQSPGEQGGPQSGAWGWLGWPRRWAVITVLQSLMSEGLEDSEQRAEWMWARWQTRTAGALVSGPTESTAGTHTGEGRGGAAGSRIREMLRGLVRMKRERPAGHWPGSRFLWGLGQRVPADPAPTSRLGSVL